MEINSQRQEGIEIVSPQGSINLSNLSTLRRYFERRYEHNGSKVVLDLSQVNFVSTGALGGIIDIKQRMEEEEEEGENKKGQLVLSGLKSEIVSAAFSSDEFAKYFQTFPTQADAIKYLSSK